MAYAYQGDHSAQYPSSAPSTPSWQALPSQYLPLPPTSLAFDPLQPLLWFGSPLGTLSSHFASPNQGLATRYTSYRAHAGVTNEFSLDQTGILSVGGAPGGGRAGRGGSVKMANRRGMCLWEVQ